MSRATPAEHRLTRTTDAAADVVMVTPQAVPDLGGIESHVAEVATRIAAAGRSVRVLATDRSGRLPRRSEKDGVVVERRAAYPRSRDYYFSPGLFWRLLRRPARLVHVQGIHTLVPPMAMLAALVRRRPYVVTFHTGGSSSAFRSRMRDTQFRLLAPLLRRATALIAVSEFEARRFDEVVGREGAVQVIRNGGSLPAPSEPVQPEPDLIVSSGRLERYKGHHRVIEALPKVIASRPDARVLILGRGPYEAELRSLAKRLGVEDRVTIEFVAPDRRDLMAARMASAGVVCLVSDYEAHPVAVMEALAVGRPVVVARTSGLTELADIGWAAGVDADADVDTVATAILAQLAHPVVPTAAELPTWDSCARELGAVYDQVLGQAG